MTEQQPPFEEKKWAHELQIEESHPDRAEECSSRRSTGGERWMACRTRSLGAPPVYLGHTIIQALANARVFHH
jgi:hypothetical protein